METQVILDTILLKQLRESRSWSQEHLASAAGLSLRTVQRMESTGNASAESRLAVAAALSVPVESLMKASHAAVSELPLQATGFRRGQLWAYGGITTGAVGTAIGIVFSYSDGREMGIALGTLGAVTGLVCAFIGAFTQRCPPASRTDA